MQAPIATALQVSVIFVCFASIDFEDLRILYAVYCILYMVNQVWECTGIAGQWLSHVIHVSSSSVQLICEMRL